MGFDLGAVSFCFRPLGQAKLFSSGRRGFCRTAADTAALHNIACSRLDACHVACSAKAAERKRKERQGKRRARRAAAEANVSRMIASILGGKMQFKHLPVLLSLCLLMACNNDSNTKKLEIQLRDLKSEVAFNRAKLDSLEMFANYLGYLNGNNKSAYLTPGSDGYSIVETELGKVLVRLDFIKQYANGSVVLIWFGNISSVAIVEAVAELEWGKTDFNGNVVDGANRTMEFRVSDYMKPATWTKIPFILEGIPPTELGFVRVKSIKNATVKLSE